MRAAGNRRLRRSDRVEQLAAGEEDNAGAGHREQIPAEARIDFDVVAAAFDRPEGNGIDHQPRLEARLDHEQSADFAQHAHWLTVERIEGSFEPYGC
jgi:hypothetical protein